MPKIPTDRMWGELARDIIFWLDLTKERTPNSLFKHLTNIGRGIPDWLKQESEMINLESTISKGTRATIIYKAMINDY